MVRKKKTNFYQFLVSVPDRLYPFPAQVAGKRTRGRLSYERKLNHIVRLKGKGHVGYELETYRAAFHIVGSFIFILFSTLVSKEFFGTDVALYVLLIAAMFAITYQEFYLHPKMYGQRLTKGIVDWCSWMVPIGIFLFTHLH